MLGEQRLDRLQPGAEPVLIQALSPVAADRLDR